MFTLTKTGLWVAMIIYFPHIYFVDSTSALIDWFLTQPSAWITGWRLQVFTATAWDTYSGAGSRAGTWSAVFVGVWFVLGAGVLYVQLRWDCCENKHC